MAGLGRREIEYIKARCIYAIYSVLLLYGITLRNSIRTFREKKNDSDQTSERSKKKVFRSEAPL